MKLNHDCVREVLLFTEEHLTPPRSFEIDDYKSLEYSREEIYYTITKLEDAGFLDANIKNYSNTLFLLVYGISYSGHEFLDNIRDEITYNEVKNKVKSTVGSVSLSIFSSIASAYINQKFGL